MKYALLLFLFLLATSITLRSQDLSQEQAPPSPEQLATLLKTSPLDDSYLAQLALLCRRKPVVGLGEASHGTHEFFSEKARIIAYLVSKEGFREIAFEFPGEYLSPIERYVQTGEGDLDKLMTDFRMYRTTEIRELFVWLREFSAKQAAGDQALKLLGLDRLDSDPLARDEEMYTRVMEHVQSGRRMILWGHNLHIAADTTMAQYPTLGSRLRNRLGAGYVAIGFDTYSGKANTWENDKLEANVFKAAEGSFSAEFAKMNGAAWFIPLVDPASPLFGRRNEITNIWANRREKQSLPVKLGKDFDALIFFLRTTESQAIR